MNVFFAMLADTWRQAKQQIVFPLVMGLMALFCVGWVLPCKIVPTTKGVYVLHVPAVLALGGIEDPAAGLEVFWDWQCERILAKDRRELAIQGPRAEATRAGREMERAAQRLRQAVKEWGVGLRAWGMANGRR